MREDTEIARRDFDLLMNICWSLAGGELPRATIVRYLRSVGGQWLGQAIVRLAELLGDESAGGDDSLS